MAVNQSKRPIRTKVVKVTLFDAEFQLLEEKNPYNSIAKLLRESALNFVKKERVQISKYSRFDRDFILELSRIGNNLNQIAKAVNLDVAQVNSFDKVKLLHLLISIDQQLKDLRQEQN